MAPVQFEPHSCKHCQRLTFEAQPSQYDAADGAPDRLDMSWNKVIFDFTLRDLKTAAADGCKLSCWILHGEAIGRSQLFWEFDGYSFAPHEYEALNEEQLEFLELKPEHSSNSLFELAMASACDNDPEFRHPTLLDALGEQNPEVDDYMLIASTDPPFRNGIYAPDVVGIRYFGLFNPKTKLILHRTARSLQLFRNPGSVVTGDLSTRPIENDPTACLNEIRLWLNHCRTHSSHGKCQGTVTFKSDMKARRPKRLIRIASKTGIHQLNLQDTDNLEPMPDFAALSYCWGGDQPVKCLSSTVALFQFISTLRLYQQPFRTPLSHVISSDWNICG